MHVGSDHTPTNAHSDAALVPLHSPAREKLGDHPSELGGPVALPRRDKLRKTPGLALPGELPRERFPSRHRPAPGRQGQITQRAAGQSDGQGQEPEEQKHVGRRQAAPGAWRRVLGLRALSAGHLPPRGQLAPRGPGGCPLPTAGSAPAAETRCDPGCCPCCLRAAGDQRCVRRGSCAREGRGAGRGARETAEPAPAPTSLPCLRA
nr:uncharacterized protein LOC129482016 [Symphalangus syndactylus]